MCLPIFKRKSRRSRANFFTPGTITIRNLTAQPLSIKSVEHAQLGEHAESFQKQEVDVRCEPFKTLKTGIEPSESGPDETLRLTLQGDGGDGWRIGLPTASPHFQKFIPLTSKSAHEYMGIYLQDRNLFAVFENTNLEAWMKAFPDNAPLSTLSIPGTHNSPTHHKALPSVRCQAVSLEEQMKNGVRFFDIRLQPKKPGNPKSDDLSLVHGAFPISLTSPKKFRPLLNQVLEFLGKNPSETLIMSLKREGTGNTTDEQLANILHDHYINPRKWWIQPRIPTLGEARGKIVLMRRFALPGRLKQAHCGKGWGLNAENWAYNNPNCCYGAVHVQDFCEVLDTKTIDKKIKLCCDHFKRAAAVPALLGPQAQSKVHETPPFCLNFLSASNFWNVGCWPDKIAAKVNPAVTEFLCVNHDVGAQAGDALDRQHEGDGGVGIVVADWVGDKGDWDLVRCIIGMNSRLLLKQGNG